MISASFTIDAGTLDQFTTGLERFQRELGKGTNDAVRWGTVLLCQSLRHETPKAKKSVPIGNVIKEDNPPVSQKTGKPLPKYITKPGGARMRLWRVYRWHDGQPKAKWGYDETRQLIRRRGLGKIRNYGLAKRSWGWFMHSLFGKSANDGAKDPRAAQITRDMVDGYARFYETGPNAGADILMHNKLDYIGDILPEGKVQRAFDNSARQMEIRIQRAEEAEARKQGLL